MGDKVITGEKKYRKLKRFLIVIATLIVAFFAYVEVVNLHSKNMTYRQKFLKAVYPVFMWFTKTTGTNSAVLENTNSVKPPLSFYDLSIKMNDGSTLQCGTLRGKNVLLVNTASDCGYTRQFGDLQSLYEENKDKLVIIGFPANDFKEQEKGTDATIGEFCKLNYGVTFPLAAKSTVVKATGQNELFQWLTDKNKNGWNEQAPSWNFCKYLINEEGILTRYFAPSVSPVSSEVKTALAE
jgi:glutathione peroxidase